MLDQRITPIHRQIVLDLLDNVPIDIPLKGDLDTIAEEFEEILRKRYDLTVDCITVIQRVRE